MELEEIVNVLKQNTDPRRWTDLRRVWPELHDKLKGLTAGSQVPVVDQPQGYRPTKDELQLSSTTQLVGGISHFATPGDPSTRGGFMGVSGEPADKPWDTYYCAMRWGYVQWNPTTYKPAGNIPGMTDEEKFRLKKYLATRKVMVTVIATGRAVVLRPADAGPSIGKRVIDVSPDVLHNVLFAETDDQVRVEWVDPSTKLGVIY